MTAKGSLHSTQIVVIFVLTTAAFAASFPAIRAAETSFDPASIVWLRALFASIALALLALGFRARLRIPWPDVLRAAIFGQLGISAFQWLLNSGVAESSIGTASTIVNTAPLISMVLAAVILRERIPLLRWVGVVVCFIGVYILGSSEASTTTKGAVYLIAAAVSLGVYSVAIKTLLIRYHPLTVTFHGTWPGILLFSWAAPAALDEATNATVNAWVGLATLVLVVTCIGYVLLARLLQELPISRVVFYYYLVPPVAIVYAIVLFGEIPSAREILGVAVVIGGVVIALSTPATTSTDAAPSGTDPPSR